MAKNQDVDSFLRRTKQWKKEINQLRSLLLQTKLTEEFKWRLPCYTHEGKNVVIIQPFKACLGLMFFKGALLKDSKGMLVANGPNSQATRRLEFRSVEEVVKLAPILKSYVNEAIKMEASGQKIEAKKTTTAVPEELKAMFAKSAKLKNAFSSLTPGRQRAYLLHFSSAKQSVTRQSRIEKCIPNILEGRGFNER